jgi:hypothetical protein
LDEFENSALELGHPGNLFGLLKNLLEIRQGTLAGRD